MTRSISLLSLSLLLAQPGAASTGTGVIEALRAAQPPVPSFIAGDQGVREYTLEGYPKGTEPCVAIAGRIGADFSRAAGVKVVRAYCASEDADGFVIKIAYESPTALRPVSTVGGMRNTGFGAFPGRPECEASLAAEAAAFADATGLAPVVSYCLRDSYYGKESWSIRVDSFGSPRLRPQTRTMPVFTRPDGMTRAAFLGGIEGNLRTQGVAVRFVTWTPVSGYAELGVSYYAAQRLEFVLDEPGKFDSKAQCQTALGELTPLLAARTPQPLALYCGQQMIGGWEAAWLFKDAPSLKTAMSSESFKTHADCMAGRARVAEHYRQSLGHQVVGSLCSREVLEYAWKVILLED